LRPDWSCGIVNLEGESEEKRGNHGFLPRLPKTTRRLAGLTIALKSASQLENTFTSLAMLKHPGTMGELVLRGKSFRSLWSSVSLEGVEPCFGVAELNLNPVQDSEDHGEPSKVFHGVQSNANIRGRTVLLQIQQRIEQAPFIKEQPTQDDHDKNDCFHDGGIFARGTDK